MLWNVGNVVPGIFGRAVVLVGVDAEKRKISRVARPDPVVCIGTEFPDRRRRSSYQADVLEGFGDKKQVLVPVKKVADAVLLPGLLGE